MKQKLSSVYLPFLFVGLGFIFSYSLFHWLALTQFESLPVNDSILDFFLPIAIFSIIAFFDLRPRIKLIRFKNSKTSSIYLIIAILVVFLPMSISQLYVSKAAGKLTPLDSISSVNHHPMTKYYRLESSYIAKDEYSVYPSFEVRTSSNHKSFIHATLYLVMPIYDSKSTTSGEVNAWLGMKYSTEIDLRLTEHEKESRYNKFVVESQADFEKKSIQQFKYLERLGGSATLEKYQIAAKENPKFGKGNEMIFISHNTPFEARTEGDLTWAFLTYAGGMIIWLLMIAFTTIDEKKIKQLNHLRKDNILELKEFIALLTPRSDYYVTPIIINANIIVALFYFAQTGTGLFSINTDDLIHWGSNYRHGIERGEYWRLLTSLFLHGGILHLTANLVSLAMIGAFLEPALGRIKFISVYFLTGIASCLASFFWYGGNSVGASGAILGLYGSYIGLFYAVKRAGWQQLQFDPLPAVAVVAIVAGFLLPGIDNAAHVGGFFSGILLSFIIKPKNLKDLDTSNIFT